MRTNQKEDKEKPVPTNTTKAAATRRRSLIAVAGATAGLASILTPTAAYASSETQPATDRGQRDSAPASSAMSGAANADNLKGITSGVSAASLASCPAGALCVYDQTYYNGTLYRFFGTNSSWAPYGIEDRNASWFNNGTSGRWARIWEHRSCTGNWHAIARGVGVYDGSGSVVYKKGSSNDWPWSPFDPAGC
jgi:hypothetical protein